MNIQFVDNYPLNLGVMSISSVLKKGGFNVNLSLYPFSNLVSIDLYRNPCRYFDFDKIAHEICDRKPDVIGFSVFSSNYQFFLNVTKAIKNISNIPVMVGGVFPSIVPKLFMEDTLCDVVFRGEADLIACELFENVAKRNL